MNTKKIEVNFLPVVILRVMVSLIFIVASLNHLIKPELAIVKMDHARFGALGHLLGPPEIPIIVSGIVMLIFGVMLLIGFKTQLSAVMLALVLIPITLTVQVGQMSTIGPLFKNIAIMGGLLFFILNQNFSKSIAK